MFYIITIKPPDIQSHSEALQNQIFWFCIFNNHFRCDKLSQLSWVKFLINIQVCKTGWLIFSSSLLCNVNTYMWPLPPRRVTTLIQVLRHKQTWFPYQVLPSEISTYSKQMLSSHGISEISNCCFLNVKLVVTWENFNFQTVNPHLKPSEMWNIFTIIWILDL